VTGNAQENAMTEIALAMAMGFFSVMVLTAMSMGVGTLNAKAISTALIADSEARSSASADRLSEKDVLVLYDGKQLLDRNLLPIDPSTIDAAKRVVLAMDPTLSMSDAMRARRLIAAPRLVITTLDANWRRAIREPRDAR